MITATEQAPTAPRTGFGPPRRLPRPPRAGLGLPPEVLPHKAVESPPPNRPRRPGYPGISPKPRPPSIPRKPFDPGPFKPKKTTRERREPR